MGHERVGRDDRAAVPRPGAVTSGGVRPVGIRSRLSDLASPVVDVVLGSVDPDEVLDRVDVDAVVQRIDLDHLLGRMDVDALLARVDVNVVLARVDVDALLDRVDVDRLLDRVDVDRVMGRVDVRDLVDRAGVPEIVRASTQDVAGSALDAARRYAVGLDVVVTGGLRRLLRRDPSRFRAAPAAFAVPEPPPAGAGRKRVEMTGRYAGLVTRLLANALDALVVVASFVAVTGSVAFVLDMVFGVDVSPDEASVAWLAGATVWSFLLLWASLAVTGRTPGGAVLGLRVVSRDGSPLPPARSAARVVVQPVSASLFGLGYVGIVLDRERRALHDLVAGSTVVYDWGDEVATLPTPVDRWLARRAAPAEAEGGRP